MRVPLRALSCLVALGLAACGGGEAPAPKEPPPAPGSFAAMPKEQKLEHMRKVVQPRMTQVFQAFDAKKYETFGCATCHGPTRVEDTHKAIVKLRFSDDGFKQLSTEKPEVMKWMTEKVTPAMAEVMGERPFDPVTKQGFGCAGCHTVE